MSEKGIPGRPICAPMEPVDLYASGALGAGGSGSGRGAGDDIPDEVYRRLPANFDQTERVWLRSATESDRGTGVLLRVDGGARRRDFLSNIPYRECRRAAYRMGLDGIVAAFKWVPVFIETEGHLKQTQVCREEECTGGRCINPGCTCDPQWNVCVGH